MLSMRGVYEVLVPAPRDRSRLNQKARLLSREKRPSLTEWIFCCSWIFVVDATWTVLLVISVLSVYRYIFEANHSIKVHYHSAS